MSLRIAFFANIIVLSVQCLLGQDGYYTSFNEALENVEDVKILDLSDVNINHHLYSFDNLETLIIRQCKLDSITADVLNLIKLKNITVVSSGLEYISPNLFLLTNLESLTLTNNPLREVTFESNESIGFLNLANNNISRIDSVHLLEKLETLILRGNSILKFDPQEDLWSGIINLDLSDNDIINFSVSTDRADSLKALNLRNNNLVTLPEDLNFFLSLERLDVAGNYIKYIPSNWLNAKALRKIDISGNPISCQGKVVFFQLQYLTMKRCLCTGCSFESAHPNFRIIPAQ